MHWFKFVDFLGLFQLQYVVTKNHPEGAAILSLSAQNAARLNCSLPLPFLQCFLSKEIKTFRRENNFHSGEEVISIWISSIFLRISTSYFLLFPLLCNQRLCSQSPHQSGYSHLNLGNQKYLKMCKTEKMMLKCARLNKSC